jgi:hypothetical protein
MYFFLATASGGPLFRGPRAKTVFLVVRWVVLLLPCFKVCGSVGPDGSWENGHCSPRGQPSGDLGCLHACLKHDCERLSLWEKGQFPRRQPSGVLTCLQGIKSFLACESRRVDYSDLIWYPLGGGCEISLSGPGKRRFASAQFQCMALSLHTFFSFRRRVTVHLIMIGSRSSHKVG